jgi:hypothetical protein
MSFLFVRVSSRDVLEEKITFNSESGAILTLIVGVKKSIHILQLKHQNNFKDFRRNTLFHVFS